MAKYTEELSNIVLSITYGSTKSLSQRIDESLTTLFNFNYPCWSTEYKKTLERKIVMHYFNYEIGSESPQLFQLRLEEKLNLIMPFYNNLYQSIIDYDLTKNINIDNVETETHTLNGTDTTTETIDDTIDITNNKTLTSENVEFDVPQVKASGKDYASNLVDINATDVTTNNNVRNATNTKGNTTTQNNTITKNNNQSGNSIPIADLILKYRDTLINIDNMIIGDLQDLFMLIY